MSLLTRIVVTSLQIPAKDMSIAEARAKAVQQISTPEPAESTPEAIENGEETVIPQPNQGA